MAEAVRVCLVGAGRAGQVHADSLVNHIPGVRMVSLVDSWPEPRQSTADKFGIGARYASLEEALAGEPFDAVVITTPTSTHRDLTLLAAQRGKHILCEKPMALNVGECDDMIAAAAQSNVVLQIGFMRRFDPEFEAAAARLTDGAIGQPMIIKSLTHGPGLPPAWARDLRTSNGMFAEVNSHDWDCVRWLAGSDPK